jgi:nucleoside recognition membrane protein YjiH
MIHQKTIVLFLISFVLIILALIKIYLEEKNEKKNKDSHDFWNNSDNWGKH